MNTRARRVCALVLGGSAVAGFLFLLDGDRIDQLSVVVAVVAGLGMGFWGAGVLRGLFVGLGLSSSFMVLRWAEVLSARGAGRHVDGGAMAAWLFFVVPLVGLGVLVSFAAGRLIAAAFTSTKPRRQA